jgi:hypothetical protein
MLIATASGDFMWTYSDRQPHGCVMREPREPLHCCYCFGGTTLGTSGLGLVAATGPLGRRTRNVDEFNPARHFGGHTGVEGANLGVNVRQERRAPPPPNFHDFVAGVVV